MLHSIVIEHRITSPQPLQKMSAGLTLFLVSLVVVIIELVTIVLLLKLYCSWRARMKVRQFVGIYSYSRGLVVWKYLHIKLYRNAQVEKSGRQREKKRCLPV